MKLGRYELRRHLAPAPVAAPPPGGELGSDGESWMSKYAGGGTDPNIILQGSVKFDIYDEMALSDTQCKALLWMLELPIIGAVWDFEDASEDPFDQMVSACCRWQFGLAGEEGQVLQSWKQSLHQAFLKNRYGCMFEEIVWGDPITWTPKDGGAARLIRPIARLAPRLPRTIMEVDRKGGEIVQIKQNLSGVQPIPGDKLAYYVLDPRPGRWDGTSILRAAWGPWELKKQLMISSGIAWDRWASGFPVVRYPQNGGQAEAAKADDIGRTVRNHERAYLSFAGPKPTDLAPDGWDFTIEGGPQNLPDPVPLMKEYGLLILWSGLLQWMGIATSTKSGARATAQVQDEPYYMAVEAHAEDLALERQRQVVRRFVDVNFGTNVAAPKLTVSKIQSEDVAQLAQTLAELKLAGFDFSDADLQNDVRERMHLPDLPADTGEHVVIEGTGLPPAPAATEAQQLRAAERNADRRFERAMHRTFSTLEKAIDSLSRQPELAPAPQQFSVTVPAANADQRMERLLEGAMAKLAERETVELPPLHFRFEVEGEKRARTATVRKTAAGETVVDYGFDEPADSRT